jgi:hypothetical protein
MRGQAQAPPWRAQWPEKTSKTHNKLPILRAIAMAMGFRKSKFMMTNALAEAA